MMRNGVCLELATPEHPTGGNESGYLPTPRATDGNKGTRTAEGAAKEWERGKNKDLGMVAVLWPTPTVNGWRSEGAILQLRELVDAGVLAEGMAEGTLRPARMKTWPTPTAHNAKEQDSPTEALRNTPSLCSLARGGDKTQPRHLNPAWVEWLMGWPIGWTDLKPLAMDKFHKWRLSHGEYSAKE